MDNDSDKVLSFDTLYTTNHIQMLKVIQPYMEHDLQKEIAIYIKYLELQYTISYYKRRDSQIKICEQEKQKINYSELISDILPFCSEKERSSVQNIQNTVNMMNTYQQMQSMMQMMGQFTDLGSNPFEQFSGFQTDNTTNSKESNEQKNTYQDPPNSQTTASDKDSTLHSEKHNENPMGNSNMMDLLKSSLTPEQQAMFEMFQHSI